MPARHTSALSLLAATLMISSGAAVADEDLVAKRELCQSEARQRFKPPQAGSFDLLKITIESRQAYVRDCMARDPSVTTAGSVQDLAKLGQRSAVAPARGQAKTSARR